MNGGQAAPLPTELVSPEIIGISRDRSALLALVGNTFRQPASMWLLPLPAGTPRQLADAIVSGGASLLPNGRVIYARDSVVYAAEANGSNPSKLAELPEFAIGSITTSPDGRRIVFDASPLKSTDWTAIYEMSSEGKGLRQIIAAGQRNLGPGVCCANWTPDGRYLIFQARTGWRWDLWALPQGMTRNSAEPVRLTNGPLS